jgi:hypothetical protein
LFIYIESTVVRQEIQTRPAKFYFEKTLFGVLERHLAKNGEILDRINEQL